MLAVCRCCYCCCPRASAALAQHNTACVLLWYLFLMLLQSCNGPSAYCFYQQHLA